MKKSVVTLALATTLALGGPAAAATTGMTYDPCANYYDTYYGKEQSKVSLKAPVIQVSSVEAEKMTGRQYDNYAAYYETFYGLSDAAKPVLAQDGHNWPYGF